MLFQTLADRIVKTHKKTCKDVAGLLRDHHKPVFRWEVVHQAAF